MRKDGTIIGVGTKTLGHSGTETSIMPATRIRPALLSLSENELKVGTAIRLRMLGYFSSKATTPGNLTVTAYLGKTALATMTLATPAAASGELLDLDLVATVLTVGATGTLRIGGALRVTAATVPTVVPVVSSSDVSIDTTIAQSLDVTAKWAASDVANTLTITNAVIELLDAG